MRHSIIQTTTRSAAPLIIALQACLFAARPVQAEIREPENVLYGNIMLSNVLITAARTDVVIQARRTLNGPPVAGYRMGSNPRVGNFYSLAIPLESLNPVLETNATQTGETVIIVVLDASGVRGQTTYLLGERGQVQRVNFGTAVADSDGDSLPDTWELAHFGNLNFNGNALAPNGLTVLNNFIAGTDPFSLDNAFQLDLTKIDNLRIISFVALRAEGPGYEGRTRFYALETSTNLAAAWTGVTGFTNLTGNNQLVLFQSAATNSPAFHRGRVWLQGP